MSACKPVIIRRAQRVDEALPHGFNWTLELQKHWQPFTPIDLDEVRVPAKLQTGLQYRASQAGQTREYEDNSEPDWPTTAGKRVTDGTVVWDAEEIDTDSLEHTIATSVWEATPSVNITIDQATIDNEGGKQRTGCRIVASAAAEYEIRNEMETNDGLIYVGIIELTVE